MHCCLGMLPGVSDFEYTQETTVFDMLDIALYHAWIVPPEVAGVCRKRALRQNKRPFEVLGHLSYNQVVEKLINCQECELGFKKKSSLERI